MKENWVNSLTEENRLVETPESWIWWSLLCCISASAGNNYFLTTLKGNLIYKPNLYVMLLGESGLGKGYPVSIAKRLVQKSNATRVIAGRSSIQAIIKELSTTRSVEGQEPIRDSRGFVVNGELSTAIIADPDSLTVLTDLYDGNFNPEWTNLLKGDGAEKLKDPYITALFGSSPAHFYDSIPQVNIEGGYIGRNLIIYEEKRSRELDLLDEETGESDRFETHIAPKYVPHLIEISKNKGQLVPNDQARMFFNTWRRKWRETQAPDKTGFLNRIPDHVLKVAMCLALADWELTGEIKESHFREAIERVTNLVYANKKTVAGRGPDPLAAISKSVIDYLLAAPEQKLTKKQLLYKGYGEYNTFTLDQALDNLSEMGWVKKIKAGIGSNSDWEVRLSGEPLESYKRYLRSKENGNNRSGKE